jgi:hypothetical protein
MEVDDVSANAFARQCAEKLEAAIRVMEDVLDDGARKAKLPPTARERVEMSVKTLRLFARSFRITAQGCSPEGWQS